MSNSNRIVKSSVPLIVDLDSSIPPTVDLESSMEASVVVLDDSYVEDALLGGGDNRARTSPFSTPKTNSNEFIRNEALATSTPAVPVNPTKPVHPVTPARPAEPVDAATPKSGEKRKRDESFIVESDDSGQEGSDEESFSSVATDRTAFLTTRDETASGPTAPDAAYPTPDTTASSYDSDDTLHNTTGEGDVTAGEGRREGVGVYDDATGTAMPDTVTILVTPEGSRVYLVGTAHFSRESQDDVSTVIRAVRPHIVCLELCKARTNILQLDEKTILEEAKNINFDKVRDAINQNGVLNGLMYILLLNMSAHLTRELGMAPGGEFRRALAEVRRLDSGCMIHLSDRPLSVTIKRALHSLSWWQTAKLTWHLVMSKEPISKEDVERCKQRDLLEQMLKEMAGEFPQLGSVFVNERDTFLAHSLRLAALPDPSGETMRVVGVVGIGHVPGIVSNWGTVTQEDVDPLMTVPPPSRSSTIVKAAFKVTAVGLMLWAAYRVLPRPRFLTR